MSQPTSKQQIEEKARALAEPMLAAEGLELVDLEFLKEHEGWVLRVFVDKPGGAVGLEDCARASHAIDPVLDVEDFIPHEYHLEVSSPGLNRPLTRPEHFARELGKRVKVKTFAPLGEPPRKNFTGMLKAFADDKVTIEVEGAGTFEIPRKDIAKANLEYQFD